MIAAVWVGFAYLAVSHAFAALWLLRMTDREKDVEILALRHQLAVLHRHADLEPDPPTARAARVRAALQRAPNPPITRRRSTPASLAQPLEPGQINASPWTERTVSAE
jgi:hypothetical protein